MEPGESGRSTIRKRHGPPPPLWAGFAGAVLCLSDVAACDLYIGIFAWRYGYIPPGEDRSITELEYRHAVKLGKPKLIFLLDEETLWPVSQVEQEAGGQRLRALREELAEELLQLITARLDALPPRTESLWRTSPS